MEETYQSQKTAEITKLSDSQLTDQLIAYYEMNRLSGIKPIDIIFILELWSFSTIITSTQPWLNLAMHMLNNLDIHTAITLYREILHDVSSVISLTRIEKISERNVILGEIAVFMRNFKQAQKHFIQSTRKDKAILLLRNLSLFEEAEKLGDLYMKTEISITSCMFGRHLEYQGKYVESLNAYQKAIDNIQFMKTTGEEFNTFRN